MRKIPLSLILSAAAAALVLLLAAVIPALFVKTEPREKADIPMSSRERATLFGRYWGEDPLCLVEHLETESLEASALAPGRALAERLQEELRLDRGDPVPESRGENLYALRREDGALLRMLEIYEQSVGDWSNWFRIYVDIDTLDVYFLYQSCKCLENRELYPAEDCAIGPWEMSAAWGDIIGYDSYVYLKGTGGKVSAAYIRGEQVLYYDTSFTSYTSPEYVVDFRIVMQSAPDTQETIHKEAEHHDA